MYRIIFSLLVVLICAGGYIAIHQDSGPAPVASDAAQTTSPTPAAPAQGDDLPQININGK